MAGLTSAKTPVNSAAQRTLKKYLANYAEPDTKVGGPLRRFNVLEAVDAVFILPIYDEPWDQLRTFLNPLDLSKKIAMVWVFNCPDDVSDEAFVRTNEALDNLKSAYQFEQLNERVSSSRVSENLSLYVLERCQKGALIPKDQGVGLARKLGMDLALALCDEQLDAGLNAPDWLHCCDADVSLPSGYFDIDPPARGQVASLYPFTHRPEPGYELAMALYDFRLHYYEAQLARAGSPYAFQTVGSIIAVTPLAYAQVRGMPKRSGGEDFYFLNKLAKVGSVLTLSGPKLDIAGRPSHRVPIGTGPAIQAIRTQADPLNDYLYYHPEVFIRLAALLECVRATDSGLSREQFAAQLRASVDVGRASGILSALDKLGVAKFFAHVKGQTHRQSFAQLFDTWFDGFITLKFVHEMRELDCPSLSIEGLHAQSGLLSEELLSSITTVLKNQYRQ